MEREYVEYGFKIRNVRFAIRVPCRKKKDTKKEVPKSELNNNTKETFVSKVSTLLRNKQGRETASDTGKRSRNSSGNSSCGTSSHRSGGSRTSATTLQDQWIQDFHYR